MSLESPIDDGREADRESMYLELAENENIYYVENEEFYTTAERTQPRQVEAFYDIEEFLRAMPTTQASAEEFWKDPKSVFEKYQRLGSVSEHDDKTVLHRLVEEYAKPPPERNGANHDKMHLRLSVRNIVEQYPHLVKVRDNKGRGITPLYGALARVVKDRDLGLAHYMILGCLVPPQSGGKGSSTATGEPNTPKQHPLTEALAIRCSVEDRTENALHLVMRHPYVVTPKARKKLVDLADGFTIADADLKGYTPLHYAVEYVRSSEEQYELIRQMITIGDCKTLIEQDRAVLDRRTDSGLSVYQYHMQTRERFLLKPPTTTRPGRAPSRVRAPIRRPTGGGGGGGRDIPDAGRHPRDTERPQVRNFSRERNTSRDRDPEAERERRDSSPGAERKDGPGGKEGPGGSKEGPGAREPTRRGRDATRTVHPSGRESSARRGQLYAQGRVGFAIDDSITTPVTHGEPAITRRTAQAPQQPSPEERKKVLEDWANKIQLELKIQCMRKRSHGAAERFLYGRNSNDIHIWFDYQGLPLEVDADGFTESFQAVKFDSVLKYVAFPPVKVRNWSKNPFSKNDRRGRSDILFFFKWLREVKKVQRILKVIVDDSTNPPHSDEAIEMALKGFGVESLDWSKPDLDPETIYNSSSDLTEITLFWSGNNAVLRAWGEPEGLRRLPKLQTAFLTVNQSQLLESRERTRRNIANFQKRLTTQPAYVEQMTPSLLFKTNNDINRTTNGYSASVTSAGGNNQSKPAAIVTDMGPPPVPSRSILATDIRLPLRNVTLEGGLDAYGSRRSAVLQGTLGRTGTAASLSTPPHRWLDATDAFADRIYNVWDKIIIERARLREKQGAAALALQVNTTASDGASSSPIEPFATATSGNTGVGGAPIRANVSAAVTSGTNPLNYPLASEPPPEVIVALIDDGVDNMAEHLAGRILTGRTFGFDGERNLPWYASESGHGTIMATMIARVCPMVKIYPIRLNTGSRQSLGAGAKIEIESVIEAIDAAVEKGASIICMSWIVQEPSNDLLVKFKRALDHAIEKEVLLFCSSPDAGHNSDKSYPAAYRPNDVIRIGAANPSGLPYEWAGDPEFLDFIFPGVEVVQRHAVRSPPGVDKLPKTGSSVATALGAGLAALIMYCARVGQMYGSFQEADIRRLRKRNFMVKTIGHFGMSVSKGTGGKFIEVWEMLEPRTQQLKDARSELEKRRIVTELARDLITQSS